MDSSIQQWLIGASSGTAFVIVVLLVLWKVGIIRPRTNGRHEPTSGERSTDFWLREIDKIIEDRTQEVTSQLLSEFAELRRPLDDIRDELRHHRRDHDA